MAADEENAPESAGNPPKGSPPRRPRDPVTIDLAANPAQSAASDPLGKAEEPIRPIRPDPPPAASVPPPRQVSPEKRQGYGIFALLVAAFVGGLAATLIGVVGHSTGLFPSPAQETADAAAAAAKQAGDGLAALSGRVAAAETAAATAADTAKDSAAKLAAVEQATGALGARLDKIESAPPPAAPSGPDLKPALAELSQRLDRLEAQAAGGTSGDGTLLADLRGRIAALETSTQAISGRIAALEARPPTPPAESGRAALAIAISALRHSASSGGAFGGDLAMLEVLGIDPDDLAALKPLAAKGAPGRAELVEEFPAIAERIISATAETDPDASWLDRVGSFAAGLVSVRPVGPIAGDTPEAIVSRMEAAVDRGDFARALAERENLPQAGKDASAAWAQGAADREAIDGLIDRLAASAAPPAAGN